MNLYIRIVDGQPFEHPILEENFLVAFPEIDLNNLPSDFAKFERIENPKKAKTFQVDEVHYEWIDGVVKDVWTVRDMTEEETLLKQAELDEQKRLDEESRARYLEKLNLMSGTAPNVID